tara:strand:- start:544 stop:1242 length:699 start_codon:yes stop_codon:yes gene_type:complete
MKSVSSVNRFFNKLSRNKLATNKGFLYLVFLIAFVDILGYLLREEFTAIMFFYLIAMIVFFYTKNMTIVLGFALIATSLLHLFNFLGSNLKQQEKPYIVEGFKEGNDEKEAEDGAEDGDEDGDGDVNQDGYQNQKPLKPEQINIPNKEQLKKQLGKADKLENAYDNLEKVIGENGIKSMSEGTKDLIAQQKELLKGLKEITPALSEAMGAISKIDMGSMKDIFEKTNIFSKN